MHAYIMYINIYTLIIFLHKRLQFELLLKYLPLTYIFKRCKAFLMVFALSCPINLIFTGQKFIFPIMTHFSKFLMRPFNVNKNIANRITSITWSLCYIHIYFFILCHLFVLSIHFPFRNYYVMVTLINFIVNTNY